MDIFTRGYTRSSIAPSARYCVLILVVFAAWGAPIQTVDAEEINRAHIQQHSMHLDAAQIAALHRSGELFHTTFTQQRTRLNPPILEMQLAEIYREGIDPTVTVEGLFFIPLTAHALATIDDTALYNITRSISTMKGIQYYSASRKRWREFYIDSFVVADARSNTAVADPLVTVIPEEDIIFVRQHDSSFGTNHYEAHYRYQQSTIRLRLTNLDTMSYIIFPLVKPHGLQTLLGVIPTTTGILFYGASFVEVANLFGFEERVENSFTNRLRALAHWFEMRLAAEIAQ